MKLSRLNWNEAPRPTFITVRIPAKIFAQIFWFHRRIIWMKFIPSCQRIPSLWRALIISLCFLIQNFHTSKITIASLSKSFPNTCNAPFSYRHGASITSPKICLVRDTFIGNFEFLNCRRTLCGSSNSDRDSCLMLVINNQLARQWKVVVRISLDFNYLMITPGFINWIKLKL